MDILFLNNYNYMRGGSERVFFSEMALLQKNGHRLFGFARRTAHDLPSDWSHFFPEDIQTDSVSVSLRAFGLLKEIVYSQKSRAALSKLLAETKPNIAHAHNIYGRLTTSVLDCLAEHAIPAIMTLHDYKIICPNYKLLSANRICEACKGGAYYHAMLNRCHKNSLPASCVYAFESYFNDKLNKYSKNVRLFLSPSRFLKSKLEEFGWPDEKVVYLPNFIDTEQFIPRFESGSYIAYVGRLSAEKGIATLIRAFKKLAGMNWQLLIVGEGPEQEALQKEAAADDRIRFTGYLSGAALQDVMGNARCIVIPSEWYENAPLSVLEAFACGKPVIGSNLGGLPELIQPQENGYLFQAGDSDDLAEKLATVLNASTAIIKEMGQNARRIVEERFNASHHYEILMSVYHRCLYQA